MRLSCCCTTVQFFRLDQYSFRICLHLDIVRKCSWLRAYAACVFLGLPAEAYATTYKLSQRILVLLPGVFVELIFGSAVLLAALDACSRTCCRLAFGSMLDAAVFSILLQRKLPQLPWPDELRQRGLETQVGSCAHKDCFLRGVCVTQQTRRKLSSNPTSVLVMVEAIPVAKYSSSCSLVVVLVTAS